MKRYIAIFALFITADLNCNFFKIPTAKELKACLAKAELEHFANSKHGEKLINKFAEEVTSPAFIPMPTTLALIEYAKDNNLPPAAHYALQMSKPAIYSCFFGHSAQAMKKLKDQGFIE